MIKPRNNDSQTRSRLGLFFYNKKAKGNTMYNANFKNTGSQNCGTGSEIAHGSPLILRLADDTDELFIFADGRAHISNWNWKHVEKMNFQHLIMFAILCYFLLITYSHEYTFEPYQSQTKAILTWVILSLPSHVLILSSNVFLYGENDILYASSQCDRLA